MEFTEEISTVGGRCLRSSCLTDTVHRIAVFIRGSSMASAAVTLTLVSAYMERRTDQAYAWQFDILLCCFSSMSSSATAVR